MNSTKEFSGIKFDGYATLLVNDEPIKKEFGEKFYSLTKDCEKIATNNWNWELGKWPWERDK